MDSNQNQSPKKPDGKKPKLNIWFTLLVAVAVVLVMVLLFAVVTWGIDFVFAFLRDLLLKQF